MPTLAHITLSEFESLVHQARLPSETRLTVMFEDERAVIEVMKRKKALDAMGKLRGSGNGKLVTVLLQERERDRAL
ncbi:MAG: hypothetical protein WA705_00890 [Candidatus Ozemobacteraceae bacterium]